MIVSMESTVRLHILNLSYLLSYLISLIGILISICFILKLYGVLIMKQSIKEIYAFSLIIGKTSEESHNYISIRKINVITGGLNNSLQIIKMDALMNINASKAMDGKSKNITLRSSN